jgi:septum formation protein
MSFILASQSPIRLSLLKQIGYVPQKIVPQDVDESEKKQELARDYLKRVVRLKVASAQKEFPDAVILGADTIVTVGRRIFQKPTSREDAARMLSLFSGRRVKVSTAVCVIQGDKRKERLVSASLSFKRLSPFEMEAYLDTNTWHSTSGGIALDELGGCFIKTVQGSSSTVLGLPLYETKNLLESFGIYADWMKKS